MNHDSQRTDSQKEPVHESIPIKILNEESILCGEVILEEESILNKESILLGNLHYTDSWESGIDSLMGINSLSGIDSFRESIHLNKGTGSYYRVDGRPP